MISVLVAVAGSKAGRGLLAALAVAVVFGAIYLKGRADGRASVFAGLASDRVTILKDGKAMDDATELLDDDGLCALLGGCSLPDGAGRQ